MISGKRQPFRDRNNTNGKLPFKRDKCQKNLRQRKVDNYKEVSLTKDSLTNEAAPTHVPIYLQNVAPNKKLKKKDPFEFEESPSQQQNNDGSESDSTIYDRSMHEVLHTIRKREKKRQKKRVKLKTKPTKPKIVKMTNFKPPTSTPTIESPNVSIEQPPPLTSTPVQHANINVISNIQVQSPRRTPSPVPHLDDNDSSDWDCYLKDENMQPWRGDHLNLRRNPHWLLLKESSLPNYNQEMILEPDLVEKFPQPSPIHKPSSPVQRRITDFVESPPKNVEVSNASSLFDDHSFSPLKNEPSKRRPFSVLSNEVVNAKRRSDCFGFGFDESDKENVSPARRSYRKLPMRVSPSEVKKLRREVVEKLVKDVGEEANVSIPAENDESVHLFEDLRVDSSSKCTYPAKRRKKHVIFALQDDEGKPRKKRKDLKTQAEEEEFNKWAASFNSMCKEVEQHSLEIV